MGIAWLFVFICVALLVLLMATLMQPKTRSLRLRATSRAKPAELFAKLSDPARAPEWQPGCVAGETLAGRDGPARRQRLVYARDAQRVEVLQQVSTWIPGQQYGWRELEETAGPHWADRRIVFTLMTADGTTSIDAVSEWTAASLFGSAGRWAARRYERVARDELEGMLARLA